MKSLLFSIIVMSIFSLHADCTRTDRTHNDIHVVRCSYTQDDIYAGYSQKPTCNDCEQRRKECFYCKCPITEHTRCEKPEKCTKNNCSRKGPFDEEMRLKRREKDCKSGICKKR